MNTFKDEKIEASFLRESEPIRLICREISVSKFKIDNLIKNNEPSDSMLMIELRAFIKAKLLEIENIVLY